MKCSILFFLLIPIFVFAGKDGERVEKKINRDFNIRANGYVDLSNKYGNLDIAIGESNHVKINVTISVKASSERKAQEALDRINVLFQEGNNRVEAKTEIESSSGWFSWFNIGRTEMEINYQVLVPADVYLNLCNKFGDIYLETTNRDIKIELAYGHIRSGDINGNLKLDMSFSEGSISQIKDGEVVLSYSSFEMEDGNAVTLDMKYTDVTAGSLQKLSLESAYSKLHSLSIGQLNYNGKMDDLHLERIGALTVETGYTGITIDELENSGDFDMRYGDLKVGNIHRGFSHVNVNTSYTGVELAFKPDAAFSVDAETNYCAIHHHDLKISEDKQQSSNSTLIATRGTGGGQVMARMNYGELFINYTKT